jgi:PKD repeat protein
MKKKLISMLLLATTIASSSHVLAQPISEQTLQTVEGEQLVSEEVIEVPEVTGEEQGNTAQQENNEAIEVPQTNQVILALNSNTAIVNGEVQTLLAPPKVIDGRTFLPLRFVADHILGATVYWNSETREISVKKGLKEVVLTVGSQTAVIKNTPMVMETPEDGEQTTIDIGAVPVIDNGVTLLPVRFMSETYGITTQYNEADKTITLISNIEDGGSSEEIKPVAEFNFEQPYYIAGQTVQVVDTSYDVSNALIVEKLWMINDNPSLTHSSLSNIFKTPKEGSYKVSLKVRNEKGIWSEWTEQTIVIAPNQKPVVTELEADRGSYAQGEAFAFTYAFENEEWESIKSERWTYRPADAPENKAVIDKPKALFAEGEYIITLQLEDAYGNMGDKKEVVVTINDRVLKSELEYRFTEGKIGDIIDNFQRFNYQSYKEIFPSEQTAIPGTMMMSDSPEVVKKQGILYKESILGSGRILLHHINDMVQSENDTDNKRLVLLAENTTDQPIHMIVQNKVVKGPSEDTLYIGQQLLYDYFKSTSIEEYILQPGEKKYIYDSVQRRWLKGQCISGLMDITTDGSVTFTAAAIGQSVPIEAIATMELLGKDIHPRGTFYTTDIHYTVDLEADEAQKLIIGKGVSEWVNGYDAITGEIVQNRGNFGITYHIKVTAKEDMGMILNPRGDIFRGAVKWKDGDSYLMPVKGFFYNETTKASVLGIIKAGETKEFEYMLPNGSSAPVLIGFIPKSQWQQ